MLMKLIVKAHQILCASVTGVSVTESNYFNFPLKLICQQICQCLHNADLS